MQSLQVSYLPTPSALARPLVYIGTQVSIFLPSCGFISRNSSLKGTLAADLFGIVDDSHFLLAGPGCVAVYKLSGRPQLSTGFPKCLNLAGRCGLMTASSFLDLLWNPSSSSEHHRAGHKSIAVCSSTFLHRVFMSNDRHARFRLSAHSLVDPVPVYLGMTGGNRVGLYR